jgi:hypothetical protein
VFYDVLIEIDHEVLLERGARFDGCQQPHQKGEPLNFQEELSDQIETIPLEL